MTSLWPSGHTLSVEGTWLLKQRDCETTRLLRQHNCKTAGTPLRRPLRRPSLYSLCFLVPVVPPCLSCVCYVSVVDRNCDTRSSGRHIRDNEAQEGQRTTCADKEKDKDHVNSEQPAQEALSSRRNSARSDGTKSTTARSDGARSTRVRINRN